MNTTPTNLLQTLLDELRGVPERSAWLLAGQILAWTAITDDQKVPISSVDGPQIEGKLRENIERNLRRMAHNVGWYKRVFETEGPILSFFSNDLLLNILRTANDITLYNPEQRRELANDWWEKKPAGYSNGDIQLRTVSADMISVLLLTAGPRVHCPYREADSLGVAVMRASGIPGGYPGFCGRGIS
jgi:hypothetical protein